MPLEIPVDALECCNEHGKKIPYKVSDFVTFIRRNTPCNTSACKLIERATFGAGRTSVDTEIKITAAGGAWKGRACICSCEAGKFWSVACRDLDWIGKGEPPPHLTAPRKSTFVEPRGKHWRPHDKRHRDFLLTVQEVTAVLYDEIFAGDRERDPVGLILFTGETSSGKTDFLQGIIHTYLCRRADRPFGSCLLAEKAHAGHLITLERPILRPIEELEAEQALPPTCLPCGLEVTRRQEGVDFHTLEEALADALRQKPALVYVDEVRRAEEWKHVLAFAATGHLIATTAHAANVPVMMARLMRVMEADTPSRRGEIGRSLFALVHLKGADFAGGNAKVPALWRNLEAGVSSLVSPGLDSLVPTTPSGEERPPYIGRAHFANRFSKLPRKPKVDDLLLQARKWDLTEL